MIYKICRFIQFSFTFAIIVSRTLFAMGACPEACNNQVTKMDCNRYQCYKDDNQSVSCKWHEHAVDEKHRCQPKKASAK